MFSKMADDRARRDISKRPPAALGPAFALFFALNLAGSPLAALENEPVRHLPASDIAAACRDDGNAVSAEICYAFTLGVIQADAHAARTGGPPVAYCLPDGLIHRDVVAAIRKYFRRNLATAGAPADRFVAAALAAAWPCDNQNDDKRSEKSE